MQEYGYRPRRERNYRAFRRNNMRTNKVINQWGLARFWNAANIAAKIERRIEIANAAVKIMAKVMVDNAWAYGKRKSALVAAALLDYYRSISERTRSFTRIIRELERELATA